MAEKVEIRPEAELTSGAPGLPARHVGGLAIWSSASRYLLPAAVVAVFLAIWQFVPPALNIPTYELPNLSTTLQGLHDDWPSLGNALLVTVQDALAGFILGNALAILGATIFAYSANMERAFYPLAIVVQTIPIVVYVPLLIILFDQMPIVSSNSQAIAVVGVTILISFFPTLVNMTVGFKSVDPRVFELMRLLNASRTQIFLKLRFPSAIPFLFSSLKITSTLAFVGAIVGEWMANSGINPVGQLLSNVGIQDLLGFPTNPSQATGVGGQLNLFYFRLDKPGLFASVLAVSVLTMLFFGLVTLLERVFVPWQHRQ
ncbi:MAG TPA: ABC transporter permease [Chloroflexota bacterium]|nr:ABC transporter permease [Chloroflexota bacterium]